MPGEHVIDPWSAPLAYLRQAVENGAEARFDAEVHAGSLAAGIWTLETARGPVAARTVVNCAGLYGDIVDERLLGRVHLHDPATQGAVRRVRQGSSAAPAQHHPAGAQRAHKRNRARHGPCSATSWSARPPRSRTIANARTVTHETLEALIRSAVEIVPALAEMPVTATYAGLRPATERKEYRIRHEPDRNWLTVGGIRSTGLTAALGLARHVLELHGAAGIDHAPLDTPVWPRMPNLAEHRERDWAAPGNGGIVCHCELVTRREIEIALTGPLPARDPGGLKRRTRAGMGRCQGFYCGAELAALTRAVCRRRWRSATVMAETLTADVAIIGGGPAGLAAAVALRRRGVGHVTVLDREDSAGGVPRFCGHPPFGMREFGRVLAGPAYARRLAAQAVAAGVSIRTGHSVVALEPGPRLRLATLDGADDGDCRAGRARHRRARDAARRAPDRRRPPAGRRDDRHPAGDGLRPGPAAVPPAGRDRQRTGQPVGPADLPRAPASAQWR